MAGVTADEVLVVLEARLGQYNARLAEAERRFNSATRNIEGSARQMENSISRSTGAIGNQLRALAATFAAAFSAQQVAAFADSYTRFVNQLRVAGVEGENLAQVQEQLFGIAQRYGVELESLGTLFSRGSQVSRELGASQAELIQFTSGVAAALRIQGSSASQAQGALLQLSQALGSGTVRAEEFNSINEGALPILQAVARNLDAAGGSVARLKALVNDGRVSSDQFFRAFLAGTDELEAQAANATMTIGSAFTVLNNALGVYIGQADDSLSATERVASAIVTLSENLDTVARALGLLAAVLLGRFAASMVGAAARTGLVSTALFALQARAAGAATSMEALAFTGAAAGRSLLAAFGGPVGVAVTALTLGIYYLSSSAAELDATLASLTGGVEEARTKLEEARERAEQAGVAVDAMRQETAGAHPVMLGIAQALDVAAEAARGYAQSAQAAAIASAQLRLERARTETADLEQSLRRRSGANRFLRNTTLGAVVSAVVGGPSQEELRRGIASGRATQRLTEEEIRLLQATPPGAFEQRGNRARPAAGNTRRGRTRQGPDLDRIEQRFLDDLDRLNSEFLQARLDVTTEARDRADLLRQLDLREYEARLRSIEENEDYNEEQKRALRARLNRLYGRDAEGNLVSASPLAQRINRDEAEQIAREQRDVAMETLDAEVASLDQQERLADTQAERRRIQNELLDAEIRRLEIELNSLQSWQTHEREIAQGRLDSARAMRAGNQELIRRQTMGPGEALLEQVRSAGATMDEAFQQVAVNGLQQLNDGLLEAAMGTQSLGDVFKNVTRQIIADLLRIAIQQQIVGPLAGLLFGGGAAASSAGVSTAAASAIGAFFGGPRAGGGPVRSDRFYRVGERGPEWFVPGTAGTIVPQGRALPAAGGRAASARPQITVVSAPQFDLRGVITTPALMREMERVADVSAARAAAAMGRGVLKVVPQRLSQFQSDGT